MKNLPHGVKILTLLLVIFGTLTIVGGIILISPILGIIVAYAQSFISKGLCKPVVKQSTKNEPIISPTPVKVELVEVSPKERLEKLNAEMLKRQQEARELTQQYFDNLKTPMVEEKIASEHVLHPQDFSVAEIKRHVNSHKLTQTQLQEMYENEVQGKARKGALKFLEGKLK